MKANRAHAPSAPPDFALRPVGDGRFLLSVALARAFDRDFNPARARSNDFNPARARALARARNLDRYRDRARDRDLRLHQRLSSAAHANPRHIRSTVSQSHCAARLTAQLVRLLPADAQARYREEFAAELDGLVEDGVTRLGQLAFALRLSTRIWSLRSALRAEAPASRGS